MELNVAYSSDDHYAKHLLLSMISLLDQNKDFDSLERNSLIMYRAYQHLPFPLYKAFSYIVGCLSRTKKRLLCR